MNNITLLSPCPPLHLATMTHIYLIFGMQSKVEIIGDSNSFTAQKWLCSSQQYLNFISNQSNSVIYVSPFIHGRRYWRQLVGDCKILTELDPVTHNSSTWVNYTIIIQQHPSYKIHWQNKRLPEMLHLLQWCQLNATMIPENTKWIVRVHCIHYYWCRKKESTKTAH